MSYLTYKAVATSRYREYCSAARGWRAATRLYARERNGVAVHVPASARPVAPLVRYVAWEPTFGWQRETANEPEAQSPDGSGGLRIYLDRPWYWSGTERAARRHAESR